MSALLHPYKYFLSEDGFYHFTTESGIDYFAYFIDMSCYGTAGLYTFSFERTNEETVKRRPGKYVLDTVCEILRDFFEKRQNAVLFVCDSTDGRAEGRRRLFARKFQDVNDGSYEKLDRFGKTAFYSLYSSLIFRKDNPQKEEMIESFERICEDSLVQ